MSDNFLKDDYEKEDGPDLHPNRSTDTGASDLDAVLIFIGVLLLAAVIILAVLGGS